MFHRPPWQKIARTPMSTVALQLFIFRTIFQPWALSTSDMPAAERGLFTIYIYYFDSHHRLLFAFFFVVILSRFNEVSKYFSLLSDTSPLFVSSRFAFQLFCLFSFNCLVFWLRLKLRSQFWIILAYLFQKCLVRRPK